MYSQPAPVCFAIPTVGDLITVAELAGHARLETLKVYSQPTDEDKHSALRHLTVDR